MHHRDRVPKCALQLERIVLRSRHIDITLRGRLVGSAGHCRSQFGGAEYAASALDADQGLGSKGHRLEAFGSGKSRSGDERRLADRLRKGALLDGCRRFTAKKPRAPLGGGASGLDAYNQGTRRGDSGSSWAGHSEMS
jgi:hypothetical protein